jgi:hypothetical protein
LISSVVAFDALIQKGNVKAMAASSSSADISISVHGFVTDPKLVGFQVLTNYESMYWRALVGNDAWSLYEVLRSFCHEGNRTCHPSIRLLAATLGLKEKRVLTGWTKTLNGKVYYYPGLIEILQQHSLVIAEVQGEPPKTHYIYHVHLTPGLLTDTQLEKLPAVLQKKHAELLMRCQKEQEVLAAKRRPPKVPKGGGNLPPRDGNLPRGGGNLPPEQHPLNTTHRTPLSTREDHNNNSSDSHAPPDVVVALTGQGISEKVAKRLASHYSKERIEEKLAYLTFLLQETSEKVQNPRGWLRRAIEEDYGPPDGYRSPVEVLAQQELQAAADQRRAEFAAQFQAQQSAFRTQLNVRYGTSETDEQFWQYVLADFKHARSDLYALFASGHILTWTGKQVQIGFTNEASIHRVEHPGTMAALKRALKSIAGSPLEVELMLLSSEAIGYTGEHGDGSSPV